MDTMREIVELEQWHGSVWKERATVAEKWHWEAAAALADCRRRFNLPEPLRGEVDRLLKWEPK